MKHITYAELKRIFRAHEASYPRDHLTANIVFSESSYKRPYSLAARTYTVSSDNKAYQPNKGGADGWRVDYCYMAQPVESHSDHISIDGHTGKWYVIDEGVYRAPYAITRIHCFLLEHETYGDGAAHIIVNQSGVVLLDDVWNGFDDLIEAGWKLDVA